MEFVLDLVGDGAPFFLRGYCSLLFGFLFSLGLFLLCILIFWCMIFYLYSSSIHAYTQWPYDAVYTKREHKPFLAFSSLGDGVDGLLGSHWVVREDHMGYGSVINYFGLFLRERGTTLRCVSAGW
jgi:hypothetical protein